MRLTWLSTIGPLVLVAAVACGGDDDDGSGDGGGDGASDAAGGGPVDSGAGTGSDGGSDSDAGTKVCGGLAGLMCDGTEYCDWPEGTCGTGDELGTCLRRPSACVPEGPSVCGCNNMSYDNKCFAAMAGQDVAEPGACM